jgi:hypothetical protein
MKGCWLELEPRGRKKKEIKLFIEFIKVWLGGPIDTAFKTLFPYYFITFGPISPLPIISLPEPCTSEITQTSSNTVFSFLSSQSTSTLNFYSNPNFIFFPTFPVPGLPL